jgi:outer membrane protein TolC
LAQAHDAAEVARADEQRASQLLDLGRQRVKAGLDNQLQIRNAETAVGQRAAAGQAAQQQIDAARNAIAALLGRDRIAGPRRLPGLRCLPRRGLPFRPWCKANCWAIARMWWAHAGAWKPRAMASRRARPSSIRP